MKKVKITAIRKTVYDDLIAKYEKSKDYKCKVQEGQVWISENGEKPVGMCDMAWEVMELYVRTLARGGGDFFEGWMENSHSAMISCPDGFRPVSFYIEAIEE
jgi:uncharacterized repeat protein (TIGR04076 family)